MKRILIRRANIDDLENIQKLNQKLFEMEHAKYDDSLNLTWTLGELGKEYFTKMITIEKTFVACDEEKIIGYLAGSVRIKLTYITSKVAELENTYVENEYRRQGIGTELINEFKKCCKDEKVESIIVTASSSNDNAISFYKKNGFDMHSATLKCEVE